MTLSYYNDCVPISFPPLTTWKGTCSPNSSALLSPVENPGLEGCPPVTVGGASAADQRSSLPESEEVLIFGGAVPDRGKTVVGRGRFVARRTVETKIKRRYQSRLIKGMVAPSCQDPSFVSSLNKEVNEAPLLSLLPDSDEGCRFRRILTKKARCSVRFLSKELNIKPERELCPDISCLGLRQAVRRVFPANLSEIAELSLKTVQKLESGACGPCELLHKEMLSEWMKDRFLDQPVEEDHLIRFKERLRSNIPEGWNLNKYPYIPNGHATLYSKRREGGNWNSEPFAAHCRPEVVISSGKPRVVTLYSEYNTRVLTPLHYSLYEVLRKGKWLLVGDPTDDDIASLNGCDYVSFDYRSATDNIKSAYVQAAVEVLLETGRCLSDDERRCLRVLGELRFSEDGPPATRGQPMGSVMSFPLLCLVNKTIVDLSLTDLLLEGKITFNEWSGHRCRINGDDLLTREPRRNSWLRDLIRLHGSRVGLVVNEEKTMVSPTRGEINSTLFVEGVKQKKVNAGALFMRPDVNDVLGFASEATTSLSGFRRVVRANAHVLAKQVIKLPTPIGRLERDVCLGDAKIRSALSSVPRSRREPPRNFFTVEPRPRDYVLTRDEEIRIIEERVGRVRASAKALSKERVRFRTSVTRGVRRPASVLRYKKVAREEDTVLSVLARANEIRVKESLRESDSDYFFDKEIFVDMDYVSGACSKVDSMLKSIKEWKSSAPRMHPKSLTWDGVELGLLS